MIIDEWQHLRQGEGAVAEYIARFDDLMIRCNIDEEPMATLARFWAGLWPEFQHELVLQEVSLLEKAYRCTVNMELYATHTQRATRPGSRPHKLRGSYNQAPESPSLLPRPW